MRTGHSGQTFQQGGRFPAGSPEHILRLTSKIAGRGTGNVGQGSGKGAGKNSRIYR